MTKPFLSLLLISLLVTPPSMALPGVEPVAGLTVTADPVYAIPTRPDRAGRLLTPVMVDGLGPYRFLVDTGCSGTMVGHHLAERLGQGRDRPLAPFVRVHDVLGPVDLPAARLAQLDIGLFTASDITAPILTIGDASGADGVLGTNSLLGRRLWVDFSRDQIRIERSKRSAPSGYDTVRGRLHEGGLLIVPVRVGGVTVPGLVDTGAERSFFNQALWQQLRTNENTKALGEVELLNLAGLSARGPVFTLPRLRVGPITIRGLDAILVDAYAFNTLGLSEEPAMVLGMDILGMTEAFAVDFGQAELHLRLREH